MINDINWAQKTKIALFSLYLIASPVYSKQIKPIGSNLDNLIELNEAKAPVFEKNKTYTLNDKLINETYDDQKRLVEKKVTEGQNTTYIWLTYNNDKLVQEETEKYQNNQKISEEIIRYQANNKQWISDKTFENGVLTYQTILDESNLISKIDVDGDGIFDREWDLSKTKRNKN
jgi:hypothetical protein